MNIRDVTPFDIIKAAWEALPSSQEEHAVVLVDVRDGSVEVIKDTVEFENWVRDDFDTKKVVFGIKKEAAAGRDIDTLYERHKIEICCSLLDIKEKYPHLV